MLQTEITLNLEIVLREKTQALMYTQEKAILIPTQEETLLLQDTTVAIHRQGVLLQEVHQTEAALEVRHLQEEIN
tara:strand:- start:125 stop:349 length:225 start_codon:yes stop_codon:yes gene_type:complete